MSNESKRQVVLQLNPTDSALLTNLVFARRTSAPPGARKLSVAEVIRQLIREAATPGVKLTTDDVRSLLLEDPADGNIGAPEVLDQDPSRAALT